jgi:hypothetical protein
MQLVSLAESRGAPLAPDRRGALRTAGPESDPQIVFRPALMDSVAGYATGDLRVELPNAPDLPLAPRAEVVRNVLPAFFAPDRSAVVFEIEREIRVVDLSDRSVRSLGPGIAPRLIPFTHQFVFLRELPEGRRRSAATRRRSATRSCAPASRVATGARAAGRDAGARADRRARQLLGGPLDGGRRGAGGLRPPGRGRHPFAIPTRLAARDAGLPRRPDRPPSVPGGGRP